jgi:hypothetical protein
LFCSGENKFALKINHCSSEKKLLGMALVVDSRSLTIFLKGLFVQTPNEDLEDQPAASNAAYVPSVTTVF